MAEGAIVRQPQVFLMDEPLSNLDAKLRVQMRAEVSALQRELAVTTLYVTHDQVEAMTMGDRVAVLRKGRLQQVDPPRVLYERPVNLFVAGFIGSPAMNLVQARLDSDGDGGLSVRFGDTTLVLPPETGARRPALARYVGREVVLGIRPEDLDDSSIGGNGSAGGTIAGRVRLTEPLGAEAVVHFDAAGRPAVTEDTRELVADAGDEVALEQLEGDQVSLVGRFDPRTDVRPGAPVVASVDVRNLHIFDPETALAVYQ